MRPTKMLDLCAGFVLFCLVPSLVFAQEQGRRPSPSAELEGFADIHVHQMVNFGFAGSIIWGAAGGDPSTSLGSIPPPMRRGHDAVEGAIHGGKVIKVVRPLLNVFVHDLFKHNEDGYPSFNSWPAVDRWTHQQVYKDWLFRAYQGGLRLMVMLATNSEDMFGRGEDEIPVIRYHAAQRVKDPRRTSNDMEALDWQVRAAYLLQAEIDAENGGPDRGWYRIVRDPDEATKVISEGKLAVILGSELQHLFNCDADRPKCDPETVVEGLNRLEAMGVNHIFPIHHKVNQFGGPAKFSPANNGPNGQCPNYTPPYEHSCSALGLCELGRFLIRELSARGMLIDTEHLSYRSFNDVMDIVEQRNYPVLASHVVPYNLADKGDRTERAKTREQIQRIFKVNGIVAPMLGTSSHQYLGGVKQVPIYCKPTDGGSVDQWANAYLFVKDLAGDKAIVNGGGHISLGSDWNGFAGTPGPRDSCAPSDEDPVTYPFWLPPLLKPAAIQPVSQMSLYQWFGKTWDFNKVGVVHIGMLPDFLKDVQLIKGKIEQSDLEPIYRSARGVVNLWACARNRKESWSRHHLRWAPQSVFETFDFPGAFDATRTIEAAPGLPLICRSRTGHKLGFLKASACQLVEPGPEENHDPVNVTAYHDGRCLTGGSSSQSTSIVQKTCGAEANQKWYFRTASPGYDRIENSLTGQCLTALPATVVYYARISEEPCREGSSEQEWQPKRLGNTFQLIGPTEQCLEVKDQSRADGVAIREATCTGASNQLWSIESLRQNDYETLYQADKNRYSWKSDAGGDFPVEADVGKQICRATNGYWLGIVYGQQCVGKTYAGQPAATAQYQGLYQAP